MRKVWFLGFLLSIFIVTGGCRKGKPNADWIGSERYVQKSVFECPYPDRGNLPFKLEASSFRHPSVVKEAKNGGIIGYFAPDILSNKRGESIVLKGVIGYGNGISLSSPLSDEYVSVWWYDGEKWKMIGRTLTDSDGNYNIEVPGEILEKWGNYRFYVFVEGDATCTTQLVMQHPEGSKFVITDIDGTLTIDDNQVLLQLQDPSYIPQSWDGAVDVMNGYARKGYYIIYLTARPRALDLLTKSWLIAEGYPEGAVHTATNFVYGESAARYKTEFLTHIVDDLGWKIVAAHGNAESDIEAYQNAGVPDDRIFVIGENAGLNGSTPVSNYKDFMNSDFYRNLPPAEQPDR